LEENLNQSNISTKTTQLPERCVLWKIDYWKNQQKEIAPEYSPCPSRSELNFVCYV